MRDEDWCVTFMKDHPWQPDPTVDDQADEDDTATDTSADPTDRGARYRKWFARRPSNPLDEGYLSWRRAIRVREYSVRGPRNNRGLQARTAQGCVGLYVLSPEELLALLYCNRFSPADPAALAAIQQPTPANPPAPKAAVQRTRLPSLRRQLALAQLPQDSQEWSEQRVLSNGSSNYALVAGWAYADIYPLKVREMRGELGAPGFDVPTRHNFLHGHSREATVRVAWEVATGGLAAETGMLLNRNVWGYLPEGRFTEPRAGVEPRGGVNVQLRHATTDARRMGRSLPEGHKHTSPDGVVVMPHGVHHTRWFAHELLAGRVTRKGLLELKAPTYTVMQARGRNYKRDGWQRQPLRPMHLPITYYTFQTVDQADTVASWCGSKDTAWVDFVPMWLAHERVPPRPFHYVSEVLPNRTARTVRVEAPAATALSRRWFVSSRAELSGPAHPVHIWITGQMLVTRVMHSKAAARAMAMHYYDYHHDIHGTHPPPRKHQARLRAVGANPGLPVEDVHFTWFPVKQVVWAIHPTREAPPVPCHWALNTYGLDCATRGHQVQIVTRPLTRHDTECVSAPLGWPTRTVPWCTTPLERAKPIVLGANGYMSCYVVHFWDATPRQSTMEELYALK
jgi:hypothetical protein